MSQQTVQQRPRILQAEKSGQAIAERLGSASKELTVSDVAAKTGLALRDAERGLQWAVAKFGGHLKVTDKGELLFSFPNGLSRSTSETLREWLTRVGKVALQALKTGVKIWIMVSVVLYAVTFALIGIAMMVATMSNRDDRRDSRSDSFSGFLFWRLTADLIGDALYATTHTGFRSERELSEGRRRVAPKRPFYERVFQFIFGPDRQELDAHEEERDLIAMIRQRKGRIGVADVMAVTGLDLDDAERRLTRLVVDYEGEIEVTDEGAVYYTFKELLMSAGNAMQLQPRMSWEKPVTVPALTGDNEVGTNTIVGLVNAFNLTMSGWAIAAGLTLQNVMFMLSHPNALSLPDPSTPLLLGWIPFAASTVIFGIPVVRALGRMRESAKAAWENGKRMVLQLVTRDPHTWHPPERLAAAFKNGSGREPSDGELRDLLLRIGGDLKEGDDDRLRWRFPDLAREARALDAARTTADASEGKVGAVVFDTKN